jgi:hypothetical protein
MKFNSHSSGGWKLKIKTPVDSVSVEACPLGSDSHLLSLPLLVDWACTALLSFSVGFSVGTKSIYKGSSLINKPCIKKLISLIPRHLGLEFHHVSLGGHIQFTTVPQPIFASNPLIWMS